MKLNGSRELYQYWNRLRAGEPAPDRADLDPSELKMILADVFLLETDGMGKAVFRLAGTRICSIFGRELKGFALSSLWIETDAAAIGRLANHVFADKMALALAFTGQSAARRQVEFETMLLPLAGECESPRALGSMIAVTRPFWLGADPILNCRLTSVRLFEPDREPPLIDPGDERSPARLPAAILPQTPGTRVRRFQHLVVLDGGKRR